MEEKYEIQRDTQKKRKEEEIKRNMNKCLITGMIGKQQRGRISGLPCSSVHTQLTTNKLVRLL